jgi:hypothetical protein
MNHERPGTKDGCRVITSLWGDLDAKDFMTVADEKAVTIEEREAGKKLIRVALRDNLPAHLQPSALVDSAGGYQPFWLLAEPVRIGIDASIEDIEDTLRGICQQIGLRASRPNVDSIMRLPGTVNCKYPDRPVGQVDTVAKQVAPACPDGRAGHLVAYGCPPGGDDCPVVIAPAASEGVEHEVRREHLPPLAGQDGGHESRHDGLCNCARAEIDVQQCTDRFAHRNVRARSPCIVVRAALEVESAAILVLGLLGLRELRSTLPAGERHREPTALLLHRLVLFEP